MKIPGVTPAGGPRAHWSLPDIISVPDVIPGAVATVNCTRHIHCQVDSRKRNVLHVSSDGASAEVVTCLVSELKRRRLNVKRMINARDKYIGGELCMLIRGKDKGRDSWHYVEVSRGLMEIFMKKTRGGTIDVAKYGTLLFSGWGPDPDDDTAQVFYRF